MDIYWRKTIFTALAAVSAIFGLGIPLGLYLQYRRSFDAALQEPGGSIAVTLSAPTVYMQLILILLFGLALAGIFAYCAWRCSVVINQIHFAEMQEQQSEAPR